MIPIQVLMTSLTLLTILTSLSCAHKPPPLVTLNQIDVTNSRINPWKVDKYNQDNCAMEGHLLPPVPLIISDKVNPSLHGGVWISIDDYKKLLTYGKTECENSKSK